MKLSARMMLAMVSLVLLATTAIGLLTYINLASSLLPNELYRIESHAQSLVTDLDNFVRGARTDILAIAEIPAVKGIVRVRRSPGGADNREKNDDAKWRDLLAQALVAQLLAKPQYLQFRLIGAADGGREIVRVESGDTNGRVRIVPETGLQQKGDRAYFKEAMQVSHGEVYISPIELNQENGVIQTPHLPVIRIATPVTAENGEKFGILIINIDLRPMFSSLRKSLNRGGNVYLVNGRGDYLVHPDTAKEFGFDLGQTSNIRDDFPELAGGLSTDRTVTQEVRNAQGQNVGASLIPVKLADIQKVALLETVPQETLYAAIFTARRSILTGGLLAMLTALGLAFVVARSLARPLVDITQAVESFTGSEPIDLSTRAGGEIGILARAFQKMGDDVRKKTDALQEEIGVRRRVELEKDFYAEKERLYAAMVESADCAILTKTLQGTITGWNPGAEHLYGWTAEEAIGQNIHLLVPPDKREELNEILENLRDDQGIDHLETVRLHKDGRLIDVSLTISPVRGYSGELIGASTVAVDITGQKKLDERLRQSQKMEAVGQLAGGIAHDFNNMLMAIMGNLQLTRMSLPPDSPVQENLSEIKKASQRASEIVRQILTFSRNQETRLENVRLEEIIEEAVRFLRVSIPASVEITSQTPEDLPPILADATQIQQVLMNLGINASHAMPAGGRLEFKLKEVTLGEDEAYTTIGLSAGDYLRLSVTDNGSGMNKETRERIFEPFFTTKPQGQGTGLGLSVAHGIMKSHEGAMTVYSEPGKGTIFHLYFPVAGENLSSTKRSSPAEIKSLQGGQILYVDDEEALVILSKRMLEMQGYQVSGFNDPEEALAAFRAEPEKFDVVITDISMPKMEGPELVRQIRKIRPAVPVVMITGYIRQEDEETARGLGVREVVLKPNSIEDLTEIMHRLIQEVRGRED